MLPIPVKNTEDPVIGQTIREIVRRAADATQYQKLIGPIEIVKQLTVQGLLRTYDQLANNINALGMIVCNNLDVVGSATVERLGVGARATIGELEVYGPAIFNSGIVMGAWANYTPTWSNLNSATGTLNWAKYTRIGKTVHVAISFTFSGAAITAPVVDFSLPVARAATTQYLNGSAVFRDEGVNTYFGVLAGISANDARIIAMVASTTYVSYADVSATVPFTWGASDVLYLNFTYESI